MSQSTISSVAFDSNEIFSSSSDAKMNTIPLIQLLIIYSLQLSQFTHQPSIANIKAGFCFSFNNKHNHIIFSLHNQVNF